VGKSASIHHGDTEAQASPKRFAEASTEKKRLFEIIPRRWRARDDFKQQLVIGERWESILELNIYMCLLPLNLLSGSLT